MPHHLFVYGTLKEGFRNFPVNRGTRLPGEFVTEQAFALYVIGEFGLPWLVHEPGRGHRVTGQVFEVDDSALAAMDKLERVDDADWYTRRPLRVQAVGGGEPLQALAYFGSAARLATDTVHHGPLAEYTEAHQALYRKHLSADQQRQLTRARSHSGIGADFCALKSVHTVLLPPSA